MKRNSMKRLLALVLCSLLIAGSIGITAMAESDDTYLYVGGVGVGEENAGDILGDGNVSFDFETNTLTFAVKKPTLSGLHSDALIDSNKSKLTIVAPNGLQLRSNTATRGINLTSGTLVVNGNLDIMLTASNAEACIYAEKGVTVNGNVDTDMYDIECCGILSPEGPVTVTGNFFGAGEIGISCAGGDVTVGGSAAFINGTWSSLSYGIHVTNGYGVDIGSLEQTGTMQYAIVADGDILVRGPVYINNGMPIGGEGIRSVNGKVECQSTVNMEGDTNALDVFIYAGGSEGILIDGETSFQTSRAALVSPFTAPNGPITVNSDLNIVAGGLTQVLAKGDITINGNAVLKNQRSSTTTQPYDGKAMSSTEGSVIVTGNLETHSSESGVYAYNNINIGGNATFGISLTKVRDYIAKAENGAVSVTGNLAAKGAAQNAVYGKNGITVNGDVSINSVFRDDMDPTGCYAMNAPDGSVTVAGTVTVAPVPEYGYSGTVASAEFGVYAGDQIHIAEKWDVTAGAVALRAVNGIVKPDNFGVTLPENGAIVALTDGTTITESDRTTVAAHAVIDEVEAITITLDPCNGNDPTTVTIAVGGTLSELPVPEYEGHKLIGWFLDARTGIATGTGTAVTLETVFNEDTTIYANWYLPGDVNGDGIVNNKDVSRLLKYLAGDDVEVVLFACDINGDGSVNNKDVTRLLKYLAGDDVEIF
jgi:hypothetical protein